MSLSPRFTEIDHWREWNVAPNIIKLHDRWTAGAFVPATDPEDTSSKGYLQFSSYGETPEEALAALERGIIETLAVGGQLEERRRNFGRRAYDGRDSSIQRADRLDDRRQPGQFGMRA